MATFAGNRKLLAALGSPAVQNGPSIGRFHTRTEPVLVAALAVGGLERAFHGDVRFAKGCKDKPFRLIFAIATFGHSKPICDATHSLFYRARPH